MVGTPGRSGGHNRKLPPVAAGDGKPESPRQLEAGADRHYKWLMVALGADDERSAFTRCDGITLATLAELLESQDRIAALLADEPDNDKFLRLRLQYAQQIGRFSALLGLTPRDRANVPAVAPAEEADPVLAMLKRMKATRERGLQ